MSADQHLPRDGAVLVEQVRSDVRRRHARAAGEPDARLPTLAVASRRDVREAQRRDGLPLACGEPRGEIPERYVTKSRDKPAALTFMKKATKRHGRPGTIATDCLRSYRAAMDELGNREKQEIVRWANNRVENSHRPFRRRERAMLRFRQMKTLQQFASVHANVHNHFSLERRLVDRQIYKQRRSAALPEWQILAS